MLGLARSLYHYSLAFAGSIIYGHPSEELKVIAVTGTKGKTTTTELVTAILEEAGYNVALSNSSRTKIKEKSEENLFKMTTPGRFFLNKFLRRAVKAGCNYAVLEITSQAVLQHRHKFIELDALIFTGIHPEHIEAHGSFENYLNSKLKLAKSVASSRKRPRTIVANLDDDYGQDFLDFESVENKLGFSKIDYPGWKSDENGTSLVLQGVEINSELPGEFNLTNILAAITLAGSLGIGAEAIKKGIEKVNVVEGRMESLDAAKAHGIEVIVDYAHTPESFEAVFELFKNRHIICVFGSTGGGRDKWKRPKMGAVAEKYCAEVILSNDDPHDEDPEAIVGDILTGFVDQSRAIVEIDRRKAIHKAIELALAAQDPVVLLLGYGNYPFMTGQDGKQHPWSDKLVAEEELAKF